MHLCWSSRAKGWRMDDETFSVYYQIFMWNVPVFRKNCMTPCSVIKFIEPLEEKQANRFSTMLNRCFFTKYLLFHFWPTQSVHCGKAQSYFHLAKRHGFCWGWEIVIFLPVLGDGNIRCDSVVWINKNQLGQTRQDDLTADKPPARLSVLTLTHSHVNGDYGSLGAYCSEQCPDNLNY